VDLAVRLHPRVGTNAPDLHDQLFIVTVGPRTFIVHPEDWRKEASETAKPADTAKPARAPRQAETVKADETPKATEPPKPTDRRVEAPASSLVTYIQVDKAILDGEPHFQATIPFLPSRMAEGTIYHSLGADGLMLLGEDDKQQKWGITGRGFTKELLTGRDPDQPGHAGQSPGISVFADKLYTGASGLNLENERLITFDLEKQAASRVKNVIVYIGRENPLTFPNPAGNLQAPISIDATSLPLSVAADSAGTVVFTGKNLDQVSKIFFGSTSLNFAVDSGSITKGKSLRVFLTRDVTSKKGPISLAIQSKDNSFVAADLTVQ
jgi:hypothetical protein